MIRRPREAHTDWCGRKTCSPACHAAMMAARRAVPIEHPHCTECPAPVTRRDAESASKWLKRRTCSRKCYTAFLRRNIAEGNARKTAEVWARGHTPCPNCNQPVLPREGESAPHWAARIACSEVCRRVLIGSGRRRSHEPVTPRKSSAHTPPTSHPMRRFVPAKLPPAPSAATFETVAEALARGLTITRIELPPPIQGAIPVRPKSAGYSGGRA